MFHESHHSRVTGAREGGCALEDTWSFGTVINGESFSQEVEKDLYFSSTTRGYSGLEI